MNYTHLSIEERCCLRKYYNDALNLTIHSVRTTAPRCKTAERRNSALRRLRSFSVPAVRQGVCPSNSNNIVTVQPITFFSPSITSLPSSPTTISGSLQISCAQND